MSGEIAERIAWTQPPAQQRRARRTAAQVARSVRIRLVILAAAAILPMLLLFVAAATLQYRSERIRAGERQIYLARSMAATMEHELSGAVTSLNALALSLRLQKNDLPGFRDLAVRFMATQQSGSALLLLDSSGHILINTLTPAGQRLPQLRDDATNNEVTRLVFERGQTIISNLLPGRVGGAQAVSADIPVLRDGRVIYDLSLVLPATRFVDLLKAQLLPDGVIASVFDRNGIIVARVPNGPAFTGQPASSRLLPSLVNQKEAILDTVASEGTALLTAFSHAEPSGWAVAIDVPEMQLRGPLFRSIALLLAGGWLACLFSSVVAYRLGQRILRPILALTRFAASPTLQTAASFGLSEVDEVAAALRHSLRERQEAVAALQKLNEELEARVREEISSRVQVQEQLAQSQRMEALGQLAGGIAHDFNNVLQAISGGLSLIQHRADDAQSVRRLSSMASHAAARGASITGRLLAFARRGELTAAAIEPLALLSSLRDMLAHTLATGIDLRVDADPHLPCLLADRGQLETVLINLAVNARDAMPAGGTVTLSAAAETVRPGQAHPADLEDGSYIRLSLADTGAGMAPDVLARACEPFFTTKDPGQGTGLGLPMARGFCQQSDGGFAIDSTQGRGTVVSLWLPQAENNPVRKKEMPSARLNPADSPMRVLLVDDDTMVCEVMAGELDARGFVVTTAHDGPAALALLDGGHQTDLLITDYSMPAMDGLTLIREARRRRPALPALLLTGYAEGGAEQALEAAQDRLTLLLGKPIGGEELAIRAAGLRRRYAG